MRLPSLSLSISLSLCACLFAHVPGCSSPPPARQAAPAAARTGAKPAGEALVGYDLRRLRPRDEETLTAMFDRLLAQAAADGKRVAVLFSADWCEPCRELETELGNRHPAAEIGDVRFLELKEEDWTAAARMDEFNELRRRWADQTGSYPLLLLLDAQGKRVEEMKQAIERLEAAKIEPTLAHWLADTRPKQSAS
jgi:thiol-disulfide isomerase/thioredoxin